MGKDLYISHARREPWVRRDVTRRGFPFWQESKLHVDMSDLHLFTTLVEQNHPQVIAPSAK
jgi:hypothetical protein